MHLPFIYCIGLRSRPSSSRDNKTPARRRAESHTSSVVPGSNGGSHVQTNRCSCRNPCRPARCCVAGRPRRSRRFSQRAVEEYARQPVGCATEPVSTGDRKQLRDHRIFVIVGTKSFALTLTTDCESGSSHLSAEPVRRS